MIALALLTLASCKSEDLPGGCASPDCASAGSAGSSAQPSNRSCAANADCAAAPGESCVSGTCRLVCTSHFDCQGFGECTSGTDSDGNTGHYCELGKTQKPGQFYTHCPSATDADCDSASGFFCISAGADDLDAYCSQDCTDDSTCAPGYACTPLTRIPCTDNCGVKGDPKDRTCIPDDQIGVGKPYQCGKRGATRTACRTRKFCSTCETDADCLAASDQVCAKDQSGIKTCTQLCDLKHPSCPWGNAATCGVWDDSLGGAATCAHRFGACVGTGKSCEPCVKDADCGANGVCNSSSFTGERWCVDLSVTCSCGEEAASTGLCSGGGCPKSPSGLSMLCVDSTPSSGDDGVCYGANTSTGLLSASSQQTGCWPSP